ncbi:hypothetical protein ACIQ7D_24005 [Streptomyces sp. NPDC096310]|uniref:hypothetical protein n=1 Tax=Streptomyces sp. NPDC096310 TaxID=3366082 RepID=UPI0037F7033D
MTAWSWAEVGNSGGSTTYDREYADRRSRARAPRSNPNDHSDHYAEKAAAREADRREAEEYRQALADSREWAAENAANIAFQGENPRPRIPAHMNDPEFGKQLAEDLDWVGERDKHVLRAEGEALAAEIYRNRH